MKNQTVNYYFFQTDFSERLSEFDDFCERQIGLESVVDDILQSADVADDDAVMVDCF